MLHNHFWILEHNQWKPTFKFWNLDAQATISANKHVHQTYSLIRDSSNITILVIKKKVFTAKSGGNSVFLYCVADRQAGSEKVSSGV